MSDVMRDYERRLRAGLAGLPRPDVDDIVEEMRSHLAEKVADGRPAAEAVAAFGDPVSLAVEIVARRVRREDGDPVPPASRLRRASAAAADFIVGWGPLVVLPIWVVLIAWIQETFLMSPQEVDELTSDFGYEPASMPLWLALVAGGLLTWALYHTRLRALSASVGMRMAGISRLRIGGEELVVRTSEVAESEPARIVAGAKWYLAPPLALFGLITVFAAFYYATMAVGSFTQPSSRTLEVAAGYEDFTRADGVLEAFYDAVVAGDVPAAQSLAEKPLASEVAAHVRRAKADGITRAERGMNVGEASYVMHEYYGADRPPRTVVLTLSRHEEQRERATFSTVYRVSSIETSGQP